MHMCMHTCAPAWRSQVVSAPPALELQEYAAVPGFVWEGWGSDQVIMPAQWTFCSPRHPHSSPHHTFSPLESPVISTRDTVLKSNFPLQPPQSITSPADHFFPGLVLTSLVFTSHLCPPPQSWHHWLFQDPFLTVLLSCSQNLFTCAAHT